MSFQPLDGRAPVGFRTPPHDIDAEQALLGAILIRNEACEGVKFLRGEHFYEPVHGRIYDHMANLISEGRVVDHVLMAAVFNDDPTFAEIGGGREYLARISRAAETLLNAEDYGRHILSLAVRRGMIKVCEKATNRAFDLSEGVAANGHLFDLRQHIETLEREQDPLNGNALVMLDQCRLDTEAFWQIDDVLPRCSQAMIYGHNSGGKTYLAASLSIGFASGQWFRHQAEAGAVLYCAFERPQDAEDRLAALRDELNTGPLPIGLMKLGGRKLDDQTAALILSAARTLSKKYSLPVRAIMIDTTSNALGGVKEDDEGYGRLKAIGERMHAETGAMVIWVHHEGKTEGRGPRGSLQLADTCTVWWRVEEREDGSRVVHVEKANRGPTWQALFAFNLVPFTAGTDTKGKPIDLCKVEMVSVENALASPVRKRYDTNGTGKNANRPGDKLGKNQKLLLSCLWRLYKRHPDGVERDILRSKFLVELNEERMGEGKESMKPDTAAGLFRRVLGNLIDAGLAVEDNDRFHPVEDADRC